jgi:enamine deaminase RidA (YjgF/YER057c/UK114 family)
MPRADSKHAAACGWRAETAVVMSDHGKLSSGSTSGRKATEMNLVAGFGAFGHVRGRRPNPPVITVQVVAGLTERRFAIEVQAIAVLPG